MSTSLPAHDDIADIFVRLAALHSPSELHGFFVGHLVLGSKVAEDTLRDQVQTLLDLNELPAQEWAQLDELRQAAAAQLAGDVTALELLLPEADVDLSQRVAALGGWCQGFLTGFAMAGKQRQQEQGQQQYPGTVSEILSDIAAIAQAGFDREEGEDAEAQYQEIVGYLRMAAVTVFVECCGSPVTGETSSDKLH